MEKTTKIGIVSPETVQRCRLVKSSSLRPGGALPALPEDICAGEHFEGVGVALYRR